MQTPQRPDDMGDLVTQIARALVDIPADVKVEEVEKEESTALRLRVAPTDVGKVIGKQGRTIATPSTSWKRKSNRSKRTSTHRPLPRLDVPPNAASLPHS